eukprot:CAMPEP_0116915610 /NCGR_PEP_ID=MMETSP0467-20121206/18034_1 /TAXON_ID=283647 /ORGANISM="Mesodinium pulex, Strain SPMC105" /LENGTH=73 /DNA_ID=CAMNT_0004592313 /DNA_START=212 /DNA_END=433 /DNA_ORIENTATION=-
MNYSARNFDSWLPQIAQKYGKIELLSDELDGVKEKQDFLQSIVMKRLAYEKLKYDKVSEKESLDELLKELTAN